MSKRSVPIYNATLRERAWMTIGITQEESRATSDELAWCDLFRALDQPTRVGTTMPEVDARRERQGHILATRAERELRKTLEFMDAYGMDAAKFTRMAIERVHPRHPLSQVGQWRAGSSPTRFRGGLGGYHTPIEVAQVAIGEVWKERRR